jgi:hypothetical protein
MKVGFRDHHAVWVSANPPAVNFRIPEPILMKLGAYIMAPESISATYFINSSNQSVCLYVHRPIVDRQRLDKNVTAATNTNKEIKAD